MFPTIIAPQVLEILKMFVTESATISLSGIFFWQQTRQSEMCKKPLVFRNRIAETDTPIAYVLVKYMKTYGFLISHMANPA